MNGLQEMILRGEIALQANIAKRATQRLMDTHENFDNIETWCSIQSILVAAGNISKILWPVKAKYHQRGAELRKLLKVEDNNPLSERKFRNSFFEHYDERVEEWFEHTGSGVYVDLSMNPSLTTPFFDETPRFTHRGYNSFNNSLVFRDETLYLDELLTAINDLASRCQQY